MTKLLLQYSSKKIIFLALFSLFFLFLTRLALLHSVPATITHDELVYATQAYSYTVQGKTLDHRHTPLSLTPNDPMYAELPATLLLPGFYLSNNVLLATHIVPAILGIIFPLTLGYLLYGLWKNTSIAIASVILTTFNPLIWQFSRMSYDAYFSTVFYTLGAALMVNLSKWWKLLSLPFFFFGFFQYQGFKLILIPFVLLIILLQIPSIKLIVNKKYLKTVLPEGVVVLVLLLLTIFYGFVLLPSQNVSNRLSRTIFSDTEYLSEHVDLDRKLSILTPVTSLATNKITETIDFMLTRTIDTFNPTLLFLLIPPANHGYALWTHGLFYFFEGVCFFLGIFLLFKTPKTRLTGTLLLLGVVGLNVTNMINTDSGWSLFRGFMSYVLLLVIASIGFSYLWKIKNKRVLTLLLGLYVINILTFSYSYFFRYPVMSLDFGNFDERIISRYIAQHQNLYPEIPLSVYTEEPWFYLYAYLLYTKSLNSSNAETIAKQLQEYRLQERQVYRIGNLSFANTCVPQQKVGTYIAAKKQDTCISDLDNTEIKKFGKWDVVITKQKNHISTLASIQDSGVKYLIHNDYLCHNKPQKNYVHLNSYRQLALEDQPLEKFCENWITSKKD